MKDDLLNEEYKTALALVDRHDERKYQVLILAVTGFAAVFGLSNQLITPIIPFILGGILLICLKLYNSNQEHQDFNYAFIIEKFETTNSVLSLERGYDLWRLERNITTKRGGFFRSLRRIARFVNHPFAILFFISLLGSFIFGWQFMLFSWQSNQELFATSYILIILLEHFIIFRDLIRLRKYNMINMRKWWRQYLDSYLLKKLLFDTSK